MAVHSRQLSQIKLAAVISTLKGTLVFKTIEAFLLHAWNPRRYASVLQTLTPEWELSKAVAFPVLFIKVGKGRSSLGRKFLAHILLAGNSHMTAGLLGDAGHLCPGRRENWCSKHKTSPTPMFPLNFRMVLKFTEKAKAYGKCWWRKW